MKIITRLGIPNPEAKIIELKRNMIYLSFTEREIRIKLKQAKNHMDEAMLWKKIKKELKL